MIKILIVDDSETETAILRHILSEHADFEVIGCAKNGAEAIKLVPLLKPDLIAMDIKMPIMGGIEAISYIMSHHPTPIVVISSHLDDERLDATFRALNAGALSVLDKPSNINTPTFKHDQQRIIDTIRSMAKIKVVKRRTFSKKSDIKELPIATHEAHEIVAIGASIGGTQALNVILSSLPANFPAPIVVVQHMMPGFISGFTKWLNENTELKVQEIAHNEEIKKGVVYFAPDNYHFKIQSEHGRIIGKLVKSPPVSGFCPSITELLKSVAEHCGKNAIGILLTGMGNDGAEGLLAIKEAQGHTIIQDKDSSIVFGMASVAQTLGAVENIMKLDHIADFLIKITTSTKSKT